MPRFRAKKDAILPDGVIGSPVVAKGDCVTVSDSEADILRADPRTWEDMDALVQAETVRLRAAPAAKKVAPDIKKVVASADEVKDIEGDDCSGDEG